MNRKSQRIQIQWLKELKLNNVEKIIQDENALTLKATSIKYARKNFYKLKLINNVQ